ncbi:hypothetical protein E2C01_057072 [Portunus trituberculatus]|uniref:Uncharacterized protein n=1 Tax=Portunus trituberculatus TaxID=210409 RepID=A0A5B7GSH7_PORTR|nr:hypothetical protein [Portunus trituberculatus]
MLVIVARLRVIDHPAVHSLRPPLDKVLTGCQRSGLAMVTELYQAWLKVLVPFPRLACFALSDYVGCTLWDRAVRTIAARASL